MLFVSGMLFASLLCQREDMLCALVCRKQGKCNVTIFWSTKLYSSQSYTFAKEIFETYMARWIQNKMNNADLFKGVIHDWQIYVRYSNVTARRYPDIIMNSENDIHTIY